VIETAASRVDDDEGVQIHPRAGKVPLMTTIRLSFEYLVYSLIPYMMSFAGDETGQDLIEYALVACLLALAAISSIKGISTKLNSVFNSISSNVTNAV
jgi:pilus assembly protein Flp/PilA